MLEKFDLRLRENLWVPVMGSLILQGSETMLYWVDDSTTSFGIAQPGTFRSERWMKHANV